MLKSYIKELLNCFVITKKIIEKNHIEFANKMTTEDKQFIENELKNKLENYNENLFIKDDAFHKYTLDEKKLHFIPLINETSILWSRAESIKNAYEKHIQQNKDIK